MYGEFRESAHHFSQWRGSLWVDKQKLNFVSNKFNKLITWLLEVDKIDKNSYQ